MFRIVFIQELHYHLYKYVHLVIFEHDLSVGKVFWKATALPLWMVMEIRWKRYCVFNASDVTMVNLLPISCISSVACAFHGPPRLDCHGEEQVCFSPLFTFRCFVYGCFVCCSACWKRSVW